MTILYFTATGNSLYIARRFGGKLVSIPQAIRQNKYEFSDDAIGVVCPLYCNHPPKIVLDFLQKAKLNAQYKFLIMTYGHANFGADGYASKLCKEQNFDYIATLLMVDNYLPVFDMNEERAIDKRIDEQFARISGDIENRIRRESKMKFKDRVLNSFAQKFFGARPQLNDGSQIEVTDKCVGCGICEKVCPIGNFYVADGVAKRKRAQCEFCLACANLCPNKAIICKLSDKNKDARYINENVTVKDIIESNNQSANQNIEK